MIINGDKLLYAAPIKGMLSHKASNGVVTHGLSEAGYDIRIKQDILFLPNKMGVYVDNVLQENASFTLASATEEFDVPTDMVGIVHDKSSWARKGLSVFNTVIEPGWKGFLTLELVYHGNTELYIPAGSGIAQVVFHVCSCERQYTGRYQNQADKPVSAIQSEE